MTNEIEYTGSLKSWLELRGYKIKDDFQNKLIYYSNSSIYPSNPNSATIAIIEKIRALATIEEVTLHCQSLYNLVETFFKKHKREFKYGASFIALFVFSSNKFEEETWNYFLHNKPASKSYSGTYIPILVDLE